MEKTNRGIEKESDDTVGYLLWSFSFSNTSGLY